MKEKWILDMFMHHLMHKGKKEQAENILHDVLISLKRKDSNPWSIIWSAIKNVRPFITVKSTKIAGSVYRIPRALTEEKQCALAIYWIIEEAKNNSNFNGIVNKLTYELLEASSGRGNAIRRRNQLHQLAESNQVYLRFKR